MTEDYWVAEILSATLEKDELLIRLEWLECADPDKPVIELRLKNGNFSPEVINLLNDNLFFETEIYFQETETEKYLEIAFDYNGHSDLRLEYQQCDRKATAYTVTELTAKLKHLNEKHLAQSNVAWQENKKLRGIINRLQRELLKEIDRHVRKAEFFAKTEKAEQYDERLRCYQKVYDWIGRFEKDDVI